MRERVGGPRGKGHTAQDLDKHVPGDVTQMAQMQLSSSELLGDKHPRPPEWQSSCSRHFPVIPRQGGSLFTVFPSIRVDFSSSATLLLHPFWPVTLSSWKAKHGNTKCTLPGITSPHENWPYAISTIKGFVKTKYINNCMTKTTNTKKLCWAMNIQRRGRVTSSNMDAID